MTPALRWLAPSSVLVPLLLPSYRGMCVTRHRRLLRAANEAAWTSTQHCFWSKDVLKGQFANQLLGQITGLCTWEPPALLPQQEPRRRALEEDGGCFALQRGGRSQASPECSSWNNQSVFNSQEGCHPIHQKPSTHRGVCTPVHVPGTLACALGPRTAEGRKESTRLHWPAQCRRRLPLLQRGQSSLRQHRR